MTENRQRELYMVGNAHIDPVWLWQWQEGLHEVRATFRSALQRMDEYPGFIFTADSVAYLEWVERADPELFREISERVSEGRFVVVGGWWIEPDCNIPHGESFVRQALYAQRFLQDRFGRTATVGCNVDPFGHAATLPQLLSKAGMSSYLFLRPEPKEKRLPGQVFWWASPDGSRVLAYRIPAAYTSSGAPLGPFISRVLEQADPSGDELMVLYGVGDHGGGPTKENIESIEQLDKEDNGLRLHFASPGDYFDRVAQHDGIPTYMGDLQHHAVGCYSAHSGVKRWNRRAEHLLMAAERWSAVASRSGGAPYPAQALAEAWKRVLFNQFHDTLAGTAIAPAYEDARDDFGLASSVAAEALNLAAQSLSRRIDLPADPGSVPVVVFNRLPWAVGADVEFETEGASIEEVEATDLGSGAPAPVQRAQSYATIGGRHRRLVLACDLPPLGYRVYRLAPVREPTPHGPPGTDLVLENEHLRVELGPGTGWLRSFFDKQRSVELAPPAALGHAVVLEDRSDTWGHDVVAYDAEIGRFSCCSVRHTEHGPVREVIEAESEFGASRLVERFVLGARSRHLEVRVTLDWHEHLKALKLRLPLAVDPSTAAATFSVPYGRLARPNGGSEEAAQAWVEVTGRVGEQVAGWALLNDGKYAYDVNGAEIGMTVARSPVYAWHDPEKLNAGRRYDYLDQGRQEFCYALLPHGGEASAGGAARLAEELNERPFALPEHHHPGALPVVASFADDGGGPVALTVLKQAEDGDAVVVRAYETTGHRSAARICLPFTDRVVEAEFAPGEVKTFLVPDDSERPVEEVSLLEWPAGDGRS